MNRYYGFQNSPSKSQSLAINLFEEIDPCSTDPQIARASLDHNIWLFLRLYICDIFPVRVSKRPRDGTQDRSNFLKQQIEIA